MTRWGMMSVLLAWGIAGIAQAATISISVNRDNVEMGRDVTVEASVVDAQGQPGAGWLLVPYVNERRWGSHESTDAQGKAVFHFPLPNPGLAEIVVCGKGPEKSGLSQWIWSESPAQQSCTRYFAKTFELSGAVKDAVLYVVADDSAELFLNGETIGNVVAWQTPTVRKNLARNLRVGLNTLAVAVRNGDGPACVMARLDISGETQGTVIQTNDSWRAWTAAPQGWPLPDAATGQPIVVLGPANAGLWSPTMQGWPEITNQSELMVGRLIGDGTRSNVAAVRVGRWVSTPRAKSDRLVCVQWEPWFTPQNAYWQTAQAVPVMGLYDSFDRDVLRQHILWFAALGIDFIMPDWSNHIWGKQHWDERPDGTNEIIHATGLLLEALADIREEGIEVPKVVLMPGLTNGPKAAMEAMNEQLAWVYHSWVRNPRFAGLWQDYDGKPLVVILDTAAAAPKDTTPVDETHFTVRWMSTQLQLTKHEELGYWTWMDGSLRPVVTYRDGQPEVVTVTPAYFAEYGWTGEKARGRRGGTTYIESFKAALETHPRVVQLHQWNEYAGQPEGQGFGPNHDRYVDSYSVELSDDLEPVSLTAPGYRGDKGGWGYYFINLTQALLELYRGKSEGDTLLATYATLKGNTLEVEWSVAGKEPDSYTVAIDGKVIGENLKGAGTSIPVDDLTSGKHALTLIANGTQTHFALSKTEMDTRLEAPVPATAECVFTR